MGHFEMGLIGCLILIVLVMMGMNLAFTLLISGFVGFALIGGVGAALGNLAIVPFDQMTTYTFTVFPMFMLMGSFVSYGGIGKESFEMARASGSAISEGAWRSPLSAPAGYSPPCRAPAWQAHSSWAKLPIRRCGGRGMPCPWPLPASRWAARWVS